MSDRDLVVVGGSLGALEAATALLAGLPGDLPAAVLMVITPARPRDAEALDGAGPLPVVPATHGDALSPGRVYVAPPDRHLLVGPDNRVHLSKAPQYHRLRPAIDPLMLTAARWAAHRTVGVLLSGVFDDGIAGLAALGLHGGMTAVQHPDDAAYPDLPGVAIRMRPDHVAPATGLAVALPGLLGTPASTPVDPDPVLTMETDMLTHDTAEGPGGQFGHPVPVGCPDCGGGMHRVDIAGTIRYRCHVGHAFAPHSMLAAQGENVEAGLLTVASTLRDRAEIYRQLAARADTAADADRYRDAARETGKTAATLQDLRQQLSSVLPMEQPERERVGHHG
ncbi:chemotaxis protein CheB [Actinoplanes aureus]|uniref:protein-glutamate methylesterase n=1 Tax=Actinoplanes aureus TaxID=2792083 RepID=A0A931C159_9ACTN|nr:chemotaxis protein CheB [Actinoplanes aureus]MBG0561369.1 chemotaxis protein CheB [Actinoplanes aureus]